MTKLVTLAAILEGRINQYGFLAHLFKGELDEKQLAELKHIRCPLNTGNINVDEGYRRLHTYLSTTWERTLEELARDYLRTFLGSNTTAYAAAYPYESVYTSPDRMFMQDARDAVLALYQAAGFNKSSAWKDGEDHIALELDFMRNLCIRALETLRKEDEAAFIKLMSEQYYFLVDHLLNWVPLFVDDIRKFARTDFYQSLAYLTIGFLETDREFLEEILADCLAS